MKTIKGVEMLYIKYLVCEKGMKLTTEEAVHQLRYKLNQAYDFMKQFTLGGINMLEKFFPSIGERVQQMVFRLDLLAVDNKIYNCIIVCKLTNVY